MSHSKLENNKPNYTAKSILCYLKRDLTDLQRKNFLDNLLQLPETLTLLDSAKTKWKLELVDQKISISILEEKINLTMTMSAAYSKHGFFDTSEQALIFKNKINIYNELLIDKKSDFKKSATKATQSLTILEELLVDEEEELCLNNIPQNT